MSNDLVTVREDEKLPSVHSPIAIFDSARFSHMAVVANVMARASLIPDHLKVEDRGKRDVEATAANCLMIVNQADAWGMDPIAVAQCTALVYGRLCYEGKLVAAVIEKMLGRKLKYEWTGEVGADDYTIRIWDPENPEHFVEGSVADWRTKEKGGGWKANWTGQATTKQLKYRGDREWARMWMAGAMLGVYTPDEFDELDMDARARRATVVSDVGGRLPGGQTGGFDPERVQQELGGVTKAQKSESQGGEDVVDVEPSGQGKEPEVDEERDSAKENRDSEEKDGQPASSTPPAGEDSSSKAAEDSAAGAKEPHGGSAKASANNSAQEAAGKGAPTATGAPKLADTALSVRFREGIRRSKSKAACDDVVTSFKAELDALSEPERDALRGIYETRKKELTKQGKWESKTHDNQEKLV